MKIELHEIAVRDLTEDYEDRQELGVVAYGGEFDVRPPYQREFIYGEKQRVAVINTVTKGFPLNVMYWAVRDDGGFEVIDGQQRTISICQFVEGDFSFNGRYFYNLQDDEQQRILDYKLMIYRCSGTDSEKLEWFQVINIAGEKLTRQELRNAVYSGPWVTDAKKYFSKTGCPGIAIGGDYLSGKPNRQEFLETAIEWVSGGSGLDAVTDYMATHQHKPKATELWLHFKKVIDWVVATFPHHRPEMKGIDWGSLYTAHKHDELDPSKLEAEITTLRADPAVKGAKGIYEYLLGGKSDTRLLDVRVFSDLQKRVGYERQTQQAKTDGVSNCPLCAVGNSNNKARIYELSEMDADHVTAWSKGGATDLKNLTMLCITHNRAKGNR